MKENIFKKSIIILSAAYFLFAGLGVNFVSYCCQTCANEGIESVAVHSCYALHHHSHSIRKHSHPDEDITCEKVGHHPGGCHLVRLKVDTAPIITSFDFYNNTIFLSNLFSVIENNLFSDQTPAQNQSFRPPGNFVYPSGREIITFHAVLLI